MYHRRWVIHDGGMLLLISFLLQKDKASIPHSAFRIPHSAFRIPHLPTKALGCQRHPLETRTRPHWRAGGGSWGWHQTPVLYRTRAPFPPTLPFAAFGAPHRQSTGWVGVVCGGGCDPFSAPPCSNRHGRNAGCGSFASQKVTTTASKWRETWLPSWGCSG